MKTTLTLVIALLIMAYSAVAQTDAKVYYVDLKEEQNSGTNFIKKYTPETLEDKGRVRTIYLYPEIEFQSLEGVGGAFNEIGGEALMTLPAEMQDEVMRNLFSKTEGVGFAFCRTAVGASDFGIDAYSYSEVADDYKMEHFSIEREEKSVIPYIQKAYKYNPNLMLFASPWSPPAWMKYSGFMDRGEEFPDKNHLKDEPKIYEAYALYFSKYISAYSKKNIKVDRLIIQNETDISTKYPSNVMSADQMGKFAKAYLKPQFDKDKINTEIWAGTFRTWGQIDAIEFAAKKEYHDVFDGIGIQYTSQQHIQEIKDLVPETKIMHTEGNCDNGQNTVEQASRRLKEVAGYINFGVTNYCYWNMILNETTESGWDWKQNSLINIDRQNKTVSYNPDFTVIGLISKYLQPGVVRIASSVPATAISVKKDGKLFLLIQNDDDKPKTYNCELQGQDPFEIQLPANSVSAIELAL
jgi:glucosylceramidase